MRIISGREEKEMRRRLRARFAYFVLCIDNLCLMIFLQKYEVEFLLNLVWHDSRLKHLWVETPGEPLPIYEPDVHHAFPGRANPRRRSYLDALHHRDRVWVPDVYFVKHGDFRSNLDPGNLALRIYPNGTVSYTQR